MIANATSDFIINIDASMIEADLVGGFGFSNGNLYVNAGRRSIQTIRLSESSFTNINEAALAVGTLTS